MANLEFDESHLLALEKRNDAFWSKLDEESDLGVVLAAGAFFESKLGECIRHYLVADEVSDGLLAPNGAIGPLGARIDVAYCLRIIEKEQHRALKKMAKIRNVFAHDLFASFDSKSVVDKTKDFAMSYLEVEIFKKMCDDPKETPKQMFIFTAFVLGMELSHREIDVWMHVGDYKSVVPQHLEEEIARKKS